ncbi:MAG: PIN domain-containing protein [Gammaproteobacteria bacterium]|jgi:hypothetical protein|nr:PIN domain-containing protein [Gammaproteobacteria bacterium]
MVLFDPDFLIWIQRGNPKALKRITRTDSSAISVQTYLEFMHYARNKSQQRIIRDFFYEVGIPILPFTPNIGHRAMAYVDTYALSFGLRAGDAIIAATAVENNLMLTPGNAKHFQHILGIAVQGVPGLKTQLLSTDDDISPPTAWRRD